MQTRETREGWPLLTVETVEGVLKDYKCKWPYLGWIVGLVLPVQETFILHWLLWSVQYKIFFLYLNFCVPIALQVFNLGRQSCRAACL